MENIKHHLINWSDGMNINKSHFVGMENAMIDEIRATIQGSINGLNYGLLPNKKGRKSPEISINLYSQNKLTVKLLDCRAFTPAGARIDINEDTIPLMVSTQTLSTELTIESNSNQNIFVVVGVDLFDRVPSGSADPGESPPRKPHVLPSYKLNLISEQDLRSGESGNFHLTVGMVVVKDGSATLSQNYIPPCTSIQSHSELLFFHNDLLRFMSNLEIDSIRIVQKIYQKEQKNYLAQIINDVTEQIINFCATNSADFNSMAPHLPPIYAINKMSSIARIIKNRIDIRQGTGKEELLNYLADWCGLNQATFEKTLSNLIVSDYEHHNIQKSIELTKRFTDMTSSLFQKLAELDYIGKRKETNIFVKEESITNKDDQNPGWKGRFLVD